MIPSPSILIVEDDPKTSELIDRLLSKEGFRTSRAADGRTAIDTFAAVGPDLVILGAEYGQRIRQAVAECTSGVSSDDETLIVLRFRKGKNYGATWRLRVRAVAK